MKIFLDANILVSVLNKEYPHYTFTSRILSMGDSKTTLVTSNICLAIAFYFAEKKHGHISAKNRIGIIAQHLDIAECGKKEALMAVQDKKVLDLEDGLEYYAALHSDCDCIITNDVDDFYFSEIPVYQPERFFKGHIK